MLIDEAKRFVSNEIFMMTLGAAVQRSGIYRSTAPEALRAPVRNGLQASLEKLLEQYHEPVSEEAHIENIARMADEISARFGDALANGRFRIGPAQKALNLYLKYWWCIGQIPIPPHCPFDAIILAKIPGCAEVRWTKLDSIPEYEDIIRRAKSVANGKPLATWELQVYD